MDSVKLLEYLKLWDFENRSKKEFAEKYNVSVRTIDNYIKKHNIHYAKRVFGVNIPRDKFGRYTLSDTQTINVKKTQADNNLMIHKKLEMNDPKVDLNLTKKSKKELTYPEKVKRIQEAMKF